MDVDSYNTQALPVEEIKDSLCLPPAAEFLKTISDPSFHTKEPPTKKKYVSKTRVHPLRHGSSAIIEEEDCCKNLLELCQHRKSFYKKKQQYQRDEVNYQFLN